MITMEWPKPSYSKTQVNKAGDILRGSERTYDEFLWASQVLTNWRSSHGYPMNTFQSTLRDKLYIIGANEAIVARRIKRTPSIVSKLRRFDSMQLARMQDIGGLRAVVSSLKHVSLLRDSYNKSLSGRMFKHELVGEYDYIIDPKTSGYRSVHLVFRYRNDTVTDYNGIRVELQIRTRLQHVWATAVETVGTFLDHALKSSEGPEEWLKFFSLAGSTFAHFEKCAPVPGYESLSRKETFKKTEAEAVRLDVRHHLQAFSIAANAIIENKQKGSYHLIVLDPVGKTVTLWAYSRNRLEEANIAYTKTEGRIAKGEPIQVVLVAAGDINELRRAYPNYFLDTRQFVGVLDSIRNKYK